MVIFIRESRIEIMIFHFSSASNFKAKSGWGRQVLHTRDLELTPNALALSKAIAAIDSNLPTYFPGTPAQFHNDILSGNRVIAMLFTIFGVVAFILSGVGLYGVMSFSVNQRTQEFGIRMALGADAMRILRMVMVQGAWQLAIGLVLGVGGVALILGVLAAAALKNILFKVDPLDPTIYLAVTGLLSLVAALSCFLPARRATRVDPIVALRHE